MKTEQQIQDARQVVRERLKTPGLNDLQKTLLVGMLNALVWSIDGEDCSTLKRLLAGEPLHAGKDPGPALRRFNKEIG